ncbi:T9SS type B sorting domain-containing protein [Flaviaesturariibacter flavus]|nr:T9SS type B sorting domain-containing protein [Flaviaesturariibacter flavus]
MTQSPRRPEVRLVSAASGNDSIGGFPKLCPYGGRYSALMTKPGVLLEYVVDVPRGVDTFTVNCFYALVMQHCEHLQFMPPRFLIRAFDMVTGRDIACTPINLDTRKMDLFESSDYNDPMGGSYYFRRWTPLSLRLEGVSGHLVSINFTTQPSTCDEKHGKLVYAYVDMKEPCDEISAAAPYCSDQGVQSLLGPFGYRAYTWYNENFSQVLGHTQNVTLTPSQPVASGNYWVVVEPFDSVGCRDTIKAPVSVMESPPPPRTSDTAVYCKMQVSVALASVKPDPGCYLVWYRDSTGGLPLPGPPVPSTLSTGMQVFWVAQQRLFGCESKRSAACVRVVDSWTISYTINTLQACLVGNRFFLTNTTPPLTEAIGFWQTTNGTPTRVPFGATVSHVFDHAGTFSGLFMLRNAGNCDAELPVIIKVLPAPVARIEPSGENCIGVFGSPVRDASVAATGDPIASWWWKVQGTVSTTQVPQSVTLVAGLMPAKLCVVSAAGCRSDTARSTVTIGARPIAAFSVTTACSNDSTPLSDHSYMPAGFLGQPVSAWQWSVDGAPLSNVQSPRVLLPPGRRRLQLVVASNIGCRSLPHDSLIDVRPAPGTTLSWSDSCAGRNIFFSVRDSNNTGVTQWWWSFGNGPFVRGMAAQQHRYSVAGNYGVRIASVSGSGCRDTLRAPLQIYDIGAPSFQDTLAVIGGPVPLSGGGPPGTRYQWSPAFGLNSDTAAAPVAVADRDQSYWVYALSPKGCDRRSFVTVRRMRGADIYIPDAFTPNNDGKNDLLRPVVVGIRELRYFSVFDRNGERVFHSTDTRSGWDGRIKGTPAGTATFVYVAEGIASDGRRVFKKGTVTLIR